MHRRCISECADELPPNVNEGALNESKKFAGGDALMGDTRTHPEHDG